jgi:hypothetical protein
MLWMIVMPNWSMVTLMVVSWNECGDSDFCDLSLTVMFLTTSLMTSECDICCRCHVPFECGVHDVFHV